MSEFRLWKTHAITEVVMAELKSRHDLLVEQVIEQAATVSHEELCEKVGAIKAYRDILNISIEDINEESYS